MWCRSYVSKTLEIIFLTPNYSDFHWIGNNKLFLKVLTLYIRLFQSFMFGFLLSSEFFNEFLNKVLATFLLSDIFWYCTTCQTSRSAFYSWILSMFLWFSSLMCWKPINESLIFLLSSWCRSVCFSRSFNLFKLPIIILLHSLNRFHQENHQGSCLS
jgi:hypothetical protein